MEEHSPKLKLTALSKMQNFRRTKKNSITNYWSSFRCTTSMGLAIKSISMSDNRRQSTVWEIHRLGYKTLSVLLMPLPELTTLRTDSLKMASTLPYRISSRSRQSNMKPMTTLWLHHIWWEALCTQPQLKTFRHSSRQTTVPTILLLRILATFAIRILLRPYTPTDNLFQIDHLQPHPQLQPSRPRSIKQCQLLKSREAMVSHRIYAWSRAVWEAIRCSELIVGEAIFRQVEETTEISN